MKTAAFSAAELRLEAGYPGPRICRNFTRKGAAVSSQGLPEIRSPLGAAQKPTGPPGLLHDEVAKPTTAVAFARPRAFPAARPAGTARFLITREKASFYETATFGRRKVFFCSPFCGLLFCPTRAKLALPAGEKPAAPKPRPPRGGPPNDRDRLPVFAPPAQTPAPATPPQSACSRRLSGCPQRPNLSARRRAESPKGKGKRKEEARMERAPPV